CGRVANSHSTIELGEKFRFAYSAAANTGDGPRVRAARIGEAYQIDNPARMAAAIHGTARECALRRITSNPHADASANRIIAGRLYRAPSAGSIHPSSKTSWTAVNTNNGASCVRRRQRNGMPSNTARISGMVTYFEPHGCSRKRMAIAALPIEPRDIAASCDAKYAACLPS